MAASFNATAASEEADSFITLAGYERYETFSAGVDEIIAKLNNVLLDPCP